MTAIPVFRHPAATEVRRLVESAGLPADDLEEADLAHFFGCGTRDRPHGVVGLELLGSLALLRSLAVDAFARGSGSGRALVAAAEQHARGQGVGSVYLLTTTATAFFERLGYAPLDRQAVPPAIQRTREYGELCPASAVLMVKHLAPPSLT
jgi:amino-acid N-acetyltransferase